MNRRELGEAMALLKASAKPDQVQALMLIENALRQEMERDAAVAELVEAGQRVKRAIQFIDDVREAAGRGEETIATGVYRDAVAWIEKAAREYVAALARIGGAS